MVMVRVGTCECAQCIAMRGSVSSPSCLTRPTTPTTVIQGASGVASIPPVRTRLPIGSWPGHSCAAICSSITIARGVVRVSASVNRRPRISGIRSASK